MGGLAMPSSNVKCDLVECCNYFDIGLLKYGDCVAQFQGMGIYDAIEKCCRDYSAKYAACTIGGQVRYMPDGNVRCCNKAYVGYNCNVDAGTSTIEGQKEYCCSASIAWTCSPSIMPEPEVTRC